MRLHDARTNRTVDVPDTNLQLQRYYRGEGWTEVSDTPPAASAPKADWVQFAEEHGDQHAADKTKAELEAEFKSQPEDDSDSGSDSDGTSLDLD
jgi:hypothetical protein